MSEGEDEMGAAAKKVLREVDAEAIRLAKTLLRAARFGALAVLDPKTGWPMASRVGAATDGDGLPAPRLTYRVDENARRMLAFNSERAAWSLEAAGARRTLSPGLMPGFGWHPLGTCRMGDDPDRSVADRDGACHDVPGLWIADASLFVSGGSVNPAATVAALALRTAERMLARRREAGRAAA